MPKLPVISGEELVKILAKKAGYAIRGQKGSHIILTHPNKKPITIPLHKELKKGTLKGIMRAAGIDETEI